MLNRVLRVLGLRQALIPSECGNGKSYPRELIVVMPTHNEDQPYEYLYVGSYLAFYHGGKDLHIWALEL